jgi:hypothetical protein
MHCTNWTVLYCTWCTAWLSVTPPSHYILVATSVGRFWNFREASSLPPLGWSEKHRELFSHWPVAHDVMATGKLVVTAGFAISLARQHVGYVCCRILPHHPLAEMAAQMLRRAGKCTCRLEHVVFVGGCCSSGGGEMTGVGPAGEGDGCVAGCAAAGVRVESVLPFIPLRVYAGLTLCCHGDGKASRNIWICYLSRMPTCRLCVLQNAATHI